LLRERYKINGNKRDRITFDVNWCTLNLPSADRNSEADGAIQTLIIPDINPTFLPVSTPLGPRNDHHGTVSNAAHSTDSSTPGHITF
jgi:hypothetical protein